MPAPWLILRAFFSSWMRLRLIWRRFSTSAGSNWTSSCSSVSLNSTPWRCVCLCVFDGLNRSHYQYNFIWTDVLLCCLRLHICLFVYYLKCNVLNSLVWFTVYTLSHYSSSPNSVIIWVAYVHSCRNIFYLGGAGGRGLMLGRGHRVCVCVGCLDKILILNGPNSYRLSYKWMKTELYANQYIFVLLWF